MAGFLGGLLGSLFSSGASSGGSSGGSGLFSNMFNKNVKGGGQRAAANIFDPSGIISGMFNKPKIKQGPAPADLQTILSDPRGLDLFNRIKARAMGQGLGISQKELDPASATFATRQRRAFNESTLPMISQQASSRGLGRSTIPINRAALEKMKTEESISERIAGIQLKNEFLKRQEQSTAIGREGGLVSTDVNQQNAQIAAKNAFSRAEFLRQEGLFQEAEKAQNAGIASLISSIGSGFFPQEEKDSGFNINIGDTSGLSGVNNSGVNAQDQQSLEALMAEAAALRKDLGAKVNKDE